MTMYFSATMVPDIRGACAPTYKLKRIPDEFQCSLKYASPYLALVQRKDDMWYIATDCVIATFQPANSVSRPTIADLDFALADYVRMKMRL